MKIGFSQGVTLTVAHECGQGTDMEHYPFTHSPKVPGHRHPSMMAESPIGVHPLPDNYDDVDYTQMRLHGRVEVAVAAGGAEGPMQASSRLS